MTYSRKKKKYKLINPIENEIYEIDSEPIRGTRIHFTKSYLVQGYNPVFDAYVIKPTKREITNDL